MAAPGPGFTFCGGLPVAASATIGTGGGSFRATVTGGVLTVDVPAGALPSPTAMTICTSAPSSPYPGDPILSFFAIDFPGDQALETAGLANPLRITLRGDRLTPRSFLQVQGGGLPRLVSNVDARRGRLAFDGYAIFEYAVYATSPFGTPSSGRRAPANSHPPSSTTHRSTIAAALVPFDKAFPLSWRTLLNAALTIGVMLLITFPAQLFNKTFDENHEEIRAILRRRLSWVVRARRWLRPAGTRSTGAPAFVAVMVVGSVLGDLNDPDFGFNVKSVETFVAVLLAFAVTLALSAGVEVEYRRLRRLPSTWRLHALPLGLLVAFACMLVSRLTRFEPGYLYGVIAGVAFGQAVGRRERGHSVALASLATLLLAVVAWIAWTPVGTLASHPRPSFLVLSADTFLAGLFVSGIVGTVISLVPLEFLPGSVLARWHRGAWTVVFAVAAFLLIQVMLHPAARSYRIPDAPIVTTGVLFGVFAAVSVAFNRYFAIRRRRFPGGDADDDTVLVTPQRVQPEG